MEKNKAMEILLNISSITFSSENLIRSSTQQLFTNCISKYGVNSCEMDILRNEITISPELCKDFNSATIFPEIKGIKSFSLVQSIDLTVSNFKLDLKEFAVVQCNLKISIEAFELFLCLNFIQTEKVLVGPYNEKTLIIHLASGMEVSSKEIFLHYFKMWVIGIKEIIE
jgi:hypothetical protein